MSENITLEMFEKVSKMSFEDFKKLFHEFDDSDSTSNYNDVQSLLLISRYPFLMPKNRFTGKSTFDFDLAIKSVVNENIILDDDIFIYNEFDAIPFGWNKKFGLEFAEDINNILLSSMADNPYENYCIEQIKEKFGTLRYYDSGVPSDVYDVLENLIYLYEIISGETCIVCGSIDGVRFTTGWISPYCEKHLPKNNYFIEDVEKKQFSTLSEILCYTTYDGKDEKGEYIKHEIYADELVESIQKQLNGKPLYVLPMLFDVLKITE